MKFNKAVLLSLVAVAFVCSVMDAKQENKQKGNIIAQGLSIPFKATRFVLDEVVRPVVIELPLKVIDTTFASKHQA